MPSLQFSEATDVRTTVLERLCSLIDIHGGEIRTINIEQIIAWFPQEMSADFVISTNDNTPSCILHIGLALSKMSYTDELQTFK